MEVAMLRRCPFALVPLVPLVLVTSLPAIVMATTFEVPTPQYPVLDSALVYVKNGDRIHLSAGTHMAPQYGWKIRRSIELFGDGIGEYATVGDDGGTRLLPYG